MELFLALMIKHYIADLGMQQSIPGSPKHEWLCGHLHYFHHGVTAFFACAFFVSIPVAFAIAFIDYIVHWHIDFAKHHLNRAIGAAPRTTAWWWTMVLDQIAHTFFYYSVAVYVSGM